MSTFSQRSFHVVVMCAVTLAPCTAATPSPAANASSPNPLVAYNSALAKLCAGDAAGARAGFAAILPAMQLHKYDGSRWLDYGRNYYYALLASGHADEARRFLTYLEGGSWKPSSAERDFFNKDYGASFAAYVADDGRVLRTPDDQAQHKLDPHLPAALQAVRSGKLDEAVEDMKADRDVGSLYSLMLGNLYAQQLHWAQAFVAWSDAAAEGPSFPQPEFYLFDEWNISALEMIFYYRAHAPSRWFVATQCASR